MEMSIKLSKYMIVLCLGLLILTVNPGHAQLDCVTGILPSLLPCQSFLTSLVPLLPTSDCCAAAKNFTGLGDSNSLCKCLKLDILNILPFKLDLIPNLCGLNGLLSVLGFIRSAEGINHGMVYHIEIIRRNELKGKSHQASADEYRFNGSPTFFSPAFSLGPSMDTTLLPSFSGEGKEQGERSPKKVKKDDSSNMDEDNNSEPVEEESMKKKPFYSETLAEKGKAPQRSNEHIPFDEESMINLEFITVAPISPSSIIPFIRLEVNYAKSLRKPWAEALILKMDGRSMNFNIFSAKIDSMWQLHEDFELVDLGYNCYLLKLRCNEKAEFILTKGPWRVFSNYINVCKWFQGFKASTWVRILEFSVELYQPEILFVIAKFDITKPLLPAVDVEGTRYHITYENLSVICFSCGRVGHKTFECSATSPEGVKSNTTNRKEKNTSAMAVDTSESVEVTPETAVWQPHKIKPKGDDGDKKTSPNAFNALLQEKGLTSSNGAHVERRKPKTLELVKGTKFTFKETGVDKPLPTVPDRDLISQDFNANLNHVTPLTFGTSTNNISDPSSSVNISPLRPFSNLQHGKLGGGGHDEISPACVPENRPSIGQRRTNEETPFSHWDSNIDAMTLELEMFLSHGERLRQEAVARALTAQVAESIWAIADKERPIALCNVRYKLITKTITLLLKPMMDKLVSPMQSSFIPRRGTHDNILLFQEMVHTLRHTKHRKGGMILKIDLEKAYDKVNWAFLRQTLIFFGFPDSTVRLIFFCVTCSQPRILWNGKPLPAFEPSCGLQQGDPLSPYLFVLCMERLAYIIEETVTEEFWEPVEACRGGPKLSHLFFADDFILFLRATVSNATKIRQVLNRFSGALGLQINLGKSKVFFSRNLCNNCQRRLASNLGLGRTNDLGKYLGVPIHHGRVTPALYRPLIEKVQSRLSNWKARLLSMPALATLIQSVTSAMPSHVMHTAWLPTGVFKQLDKMNRAFLWAKDGNPRKMHTVRWSTVT
ncbi:hypothetical protein BUALT_Bualt18G0097700 [Buddleja alternifolia]|uniref:CCHC-type domain-containing protein n=1 Tax=Buddleja alternifolia TaxID=168488 RepID=A0AAV6WBT4_9LAMI|nr:hypothetical protein BUALT_Bualt18G0097700 [Buddleja alternifolia]